MNKPVVSVLRVSITLPRGVSADKARAAVRRVLGCAPGEIVRTAVADCLESSRMAAKGTKVVPRSQS